MMSQAMRTQQKRIVTPGKPQSLNNTTEIPEQKKITSRTPNDQATDKTKSSPNQLK